MAKDKLTTCSNMMWSPIYCPGNKPGPVACKYKIRGVMLILWAKEARQPNPLDRYYFQDNIYRSMIQNNIFAISQYHLFPMTTPKRAIYCLLFPMLSLMHDFSYAKSNTCFSYAKSNTW